MAIFEIITKNLEIPKKIPKQKIREFAQEIGMTKKLIVIPKIGE